VISILRRSGLVALFNQAGIPRRRHNRNVARSRANQAGEPDNRNVARMALLLAGLPTVPGETVNRLCASGLSAVASAARVHQGRRGRLYIAGGVRACRARRT
jgi:acetyl-CoA acetyltransferase